MYILVLKGVYRHELLYVTTDYRHALIEARHLIEAQKDAYHTIQVVQMIYGEHEEKVVAEVLRKDTYGSPPMLENKFYGASPIIKTEITLQEHN